MPTVTFETGEEKLEAAFAAIAALQLMVMRLNMREEIDSFMIQLMLTQVSDSDAMIKGWQSIVARYYPRQALRNLEVGDGEPTPELTEELDLRIAYWTKVLDVHRAARGQ
jgi:hypothetical protein